MAAVGAARPGLRKGSSSACRAATRRAQRRYQGMRILWNNEQYGVLTECQWRAAERILPAGRYRLWGILFRRSFFGILRAD